MSGDDNNAILILFSMATELKQTIERQKKTAKKKTTKKQAEPIEDKGIGTHPARVTLYLPPDERAIWQQALAMSGQYDSLSGMARDLVKKYHRAMLKKVQKECAT